MIASACMMSHEEEHLKMIAPSPDKVMAEAREHMHQAKVNNVKELKD